MSYQKARLSIFVVHILNFSFSKQFLRWGYDCNLKLA